MSGSVPFGPIVNKDGTPTEAFRRFLQQLSEATGGPAYEIKLVRVSDTVVHVRLKGADGTTRESAADITLS